MVQSNNFTTYGIQNDYERRILIFFNVGVALSALIGDTIILIGITKYNAVKLHRVIVVIILHLAVSDLLLATFETIPQIVSLISQKWVLGEVFCRLNPIVNGICITATAALTCVLTTNKLLLVLYPLKAESWSARRAHLICAFFWALGLLQPGQISTMLFTSTDDWKFSYYDYTCNGDLSDAPLWLRWFSSAFTFGGLLLAFLILIITSALLLIKARKLALMRGRNLRWQGVLAVLATTAVYLVSNMPWFVLEVSSLVVTHSIKTWRIALFISNLNIMANFYVYCLTVRSFREFICSSAQRLARKLGIDLAPPEAAEARNQVVPVPQRNPTMRTLVRGQQNQVV